MADFLFYDPSTFTDPNDVDTSYLGYQTPEQQQAAADFRFYNVTSTPAPTPAQQAAAAKAVVAQATTYKSPEQLAAEKDRQKMLLLIFVVAVGALALKGR